MQQLESLYHVLLDWIKNVRYDLENFRVEDKQRTSFRRSLYFLEILEELFSIVIFEYHEINWKFIRSSFFLFHLFN